MKKTILLILLIWLSFYISGCDHKYNLVIEDSEYIVLKPEKTNFYAGDNIEIKTIILDDLDIELYLNDVIVRNRSYIVEANKAYWKYKVTMPREDSNITIFTKEKKIIKINDISTDDKVTQYYADDINGTVGSATLDDEQIEIFQDMYSKLLTTEAYQDVYCNCKAKISLNYRYDHKKNGKVINYFYKIAYHEHGIIVQNHAGYFQVIESDIFNRQLVLDMLGLFYVLEDDYIVSEYDSLKANALEKQFFESKNWPSDFGFGNLETHIYGSVDSYDDAIKHYNSRVNGNKNYKYEYSLKEENELYYLINVKLTTVENGNTNEYVIMYYKNSVYDYDNNIIHSYDFNVIKRILDNNYYSSKYQISGCKSLYSQLFDKGDYYLYVNYNINCAFGDYDMSDKLTYGRMTTIIAKDGLIVKTNYKLIDIVYGDYDRVKQ